MDRAVDFKLKDEPHFHQLLFQPLRHRAGGVVRGCLVATASFVAVLIAAVVEGLAAVTAHIHFFDGIWKIELCFI
jgi:hypothetical protein